MRDGHGPAYLGLLRGAHALQAVLRQGAGVEAGAVPEAGVPHVPAPDGREQVPAQLDS